VKPTNNALHLKYTFYTRIAAAGGSYAWFGPYYVDVGCTTTSVTFADASNFVTNVPVWVGSATADRYTLNVPTATRSWCLIVSSEIVNPDGTSWSGHN